MQPSLVSCKISTFKSGLFCAVANPTSFAHLFKGLEKLYIISSNLNAPLKDWMNKLTTNVTFCKYWTLSNMGCPIAVVMRLSVTSIPTELNYGWLTLHIDRTAMYHKRTCLTRSWLENTKYMQFMKRVCFNHIIVIQYHFIYMEFSFGVGLLPVGPYQIS